MGSSIISNRCFKTAFDYVTLAGSVCTIDGNRFQQSFIPDCKCIVGEVRASFVWMLQLANP